MEDKINVYDINWEEVVIRQEELKKQESLSPEEAEELQQINNGITALLKDYQSKMNTTKGRYHPGKEFYRNMGNTNARVQEFLPRIQSNQKAILIDHEFLKGSNSSE